jgi:hypothetical protein
MLTTNQIDISKRRHPDHIFIVGLGRTGSTLTRTILNSSPQIGIGGESHFLRDLPRLGLHARRGFRERLARQGDLSTEAGAHNVVAYLFRPHHGHFKFWHLHTKHIDQDTFLQHLLQTDRSERALFDLVMAVHARGKPIRGDKTPAHIFAVPTLLAWFPNAKIIHTFRDPRAIYVSRKRKADKKGTTGVTAMARNVGLVFELYASMHLMLTWFQVLRLHRRYRTRYPDRYYLLKYEDLIHDPERSVRDLCGFLNVDFSEAMLQQAVINSSYVASGQVAGFDPVAVDRWRAHLHPLINRWFLVWCRNQLLEFGYQP